MKKKIAATLILVSAFTAGSLALAPKADAHHGYRLSCREIARGARHAVFHRTGSYRAARHAFYRARNRCVNRRIHRRRHIRPRVIVFPRWGYYPY